jgi:CubicO group peptidase (beta-lactamase class C family)
MTVSADERMLRAMQSLQRETPFTLKRRAPSTLSNQMALYATPGVAVSVINNGELAAEGSFGVKTAGTDDAVTPTTLFQAGSISKPVFALAVMRLVDAGRLDLDADVNDYLTSWRVPDNGRWTPRVTLRQLLSHTAATSVHGFPGYPAAGPWPTLTDVLNGVPPANTLPIVVEGLPGIHFRYSGGGTTIAQQLVMDVLRQPFPQLMRELVLGPTGMHDSTFEQPLPSAMASRAATGHPWNGVPVPGGWHVYPEMAAAGLWTTASDLARLGAAVMRTLHGRDSALGLKSETVAAMLRPQLADQKVGSDFAGLGWFCNGEGDAFRFGHGGEDHGFIAHMRMFPNRASGAVVMINSIQGWPLPSEILTALGREYGWPRVSDLTDETATHGDYSYAGAYRRDDGRMVHIDETRRGLSLRFGKQAPVPLTAISDGKFVSSAIDLRVSFEQGGNGNATALTITQLGALLKFERVSE